MTGLIEVTQQVEQASSIFQKMDHIWRRSRLLLALQVDEQVERRRIEPAAGPEDMNELLGLGIWASSPSTTAGLQPPRCSELRPLRLRAHATAHQLTA